MIEFKGHKFILNYSEFFHDRYKCRICYKFAYWSHDKNEFRELHYLKNTLIPSHYSNIELTCDEEQIKKLLE